jgi:hypothetical protein
MKRVTVHCTPSFYAGEIVAPIKSSAQWGVTRFYALQHLPSLPERAAALMPLLCGWIPPGCASCAPFSSVSLTHSTTCSLRSSASDGAAPHAICPRLPLIVCASRMPSPAPTLLPHGSLLAEFDATGISRRDASAAINLRKVSADAANRRNDQPARIRQTRRLLRTARA